MAGAERVGGLTAVDAQVGVRAAGWREAIALACRPLVDAGAVEPRYVTACAALIDEHGPYIVLAPGIALAHARPEDGVHGVGLTVAVLDEPVRFGHPANDPVDLVFAFASPDRDQHVGLLAALSRALVADLAATLRSADAATARRRLETILDDVVRDR